MCMNKNGAITRTPCTKRGAPCCVGGMSSVISFFSIKLLLLPFYSCFTRAFCFFVLVFPSNVLGTQTMWFDSLIT